MDEDAIGSESRGKLDDDVDALFKLPLAKFIGARNELATRLKRAGHANDANLVKALAKPSISAWAVNQLHWRHREALEVLLTTGHRLRQAQTAPATGRIADLLGSLDARREALSNLTDLATALLREAGNNPTPDTIHRITTTLEAVSAYATPSDGPAPGRLTQDVDPPGFGSLASLISGDSTTGRNEPPSQTHSRKSGSTATKTTPVASPAGDLRKARQADETHRARIAAAKTTLQEARKSLTGAQSGADRLEAAQKKADAEAKDADAEAKRAEKQLRQAEERFKKASAASKDAKDRAQRIAAEKEEALQTVEAARHAIEKASKELASLSQESPVR